MAVRVLLTLCSAPACAVPIPGHGEIVVGRVKKCENFVERVVPGLDIRCRNATASLRIGFSGERFFERGPIRACEQPSAAIHGWGLHHLEYVAPSDVHFVHATELGAALSFGREATGVFVGASSRTRLQLPRRGSFLIRLFYDSRDPERTVFRVDGHLRRNP